MNLKNQIINILNIVAPLKTFKERPQKIAPWGDAELLEKRRARDHYYFKYTNLNISYTAAEKAFNLQKYRELRAECQSLQPIKMKEYFNSKKISDFKKSKCYLKFYSSSVKIKSNKVEDLSTYLFLHENQIIDKVEILSFLQTLFRVKANVIIT